MFDPETQPASESDPQSLKAAAPALAAVPVDGGSAAQKEPSAAGKEPSTTPKESDPEAKPGGHLKLID